ncbi:hypothetical protein V6N11_016758 [Hibiscus sabdariffa]|uniref:RNase H type-1 domain-containing protein n=1 Tax=Hibiscus sabdariffa TaxID=183260 RepID=A0ABR2TW07_9ROSI
MDPSFIEHGDMLVQGLRMVEECRSTTAGRGVAGRGVAGRNIAAGRGVAGRSNAASSALTCCREGLDQGCSAPRQGWIKANADGANCLEVERILLGKSKALPGNAIVEDIREMLARNWVVRISRVSRNSNKVADALAISIRDDPVGVRFFDLAPLFVSKLVYEDVNGRSKVSDDYVP